MLYLSDAKYSADILTLDLIKKLLSYCIRSKAVSPFWRNYRISWKRAL